MFIEQAFKTMDFQPQRMLDLCAAPGGKSTLWRSLLPDGALLVANEPIRQRAMILLENLTKWGHPDGVSANAPRGIHRHRHKKQKKRRPTPPVAGGKNVAQWLANDGDFKLFRPNETHICAVRNGLFEDVERVCNTVRSLSAGIVLAEEKGRKFAPTTELALSTQRNDAALCSGVLSRTSYGISQQPRFACQQPLYIGVAYQDKDVVGYLTLKTNLHLYYI